MPHGLNLKVMAMLGYHSSETHEELDESSVCSSIGNEGVLFIPAYHARLGQIPLLSILKPTVLHKSLLGPLGRSHIETKRARE